MKRVFQAVIYAALVCTLGIEIWVLGSLINGFFRGRT
jgi:hypothetical protein